VDAFLTAPRDQPKVLEVGLGICVTLNDQRLLISRNRFAALRGTHAEYLSFLNRLVFFWPGTEEGPKPKGVDSRKGSRSKHLSVLCQFGL
jgi:hypothetical protein